MTETMGTTPAGTPSGDTSTRDVAKEEARGVAQDAVQSGRDTAETAKQQASEVAGEAKNQAVNVLDQAREELSSQGAAQQQRAASTLRTLADDLSGMANGDTDTDAGGMAADLANQASARIRGVADFLENREPGEVLDEVKRFARRKPGTFLLAAAAVGFVGGRLTRGLTSAAHDDGSPRRLTGGTAPTGTEYSHGARTGIPVAQSGQSGQTSDAPGATFATDTAGAESDVSPNASEYAYPPATNTALENADTFDPTAVDTPITPSAAGLGTSGEERVR